MMKKRQWAAVIGAGLLAATPVWAAKTLSVCTEASPEGFDIAQYDSAVTQDAAGETLYERLVEFKRGATSVEPGLAEKWTISKDGLTYTFNLRRGVKFHTTEYFKPSRNFNADDVVFSFLRMVDKNHPWYKQAANGFPYATGMEFPDLVKSVEKVDDYTVKITLARQEAPFLADLAMGFASIMSAEYAAQLDKAGKQQDLNLKPVGTGPFVLKSYQKDAMVRYSANTEYWRGKAKVDSLVFAITPDPNVRQQRVKAGECQIALYPKPDQVESLKADKNITVGSLATLYTGYIAPNVEKPFLKDKKFRQALAYSFDKQGFIKSIFGGNAKPAVTVLPPTMWSSTTEKLKERSADLEKAKKLVKESGYDGSELKIWARVGGLFDSKRAAEMLQADWAKIGVKVSVQQMEWGELLKRSGKGEHDITILGWAGDNGDPDNFFTPNLSCDAYKSGGNRSRWCNKDFDKVLADARLETDQKKRTKLYEKAQQIVYDDVPWIPTVHMIAFVAQRKNVSGFVQSPFMTNNFYTVDLK